MARRRTGTDEETGAADEDESKVTRYTGGRRLQRAALALALAATVVFGLLPSQTDTLAAAAAHDQQAVASVLADESLWKGLSADDRGDVHVDDILDHGAQIKRQEQYYASVVTPLEAKLEAARQDDARTGIEAAAAVTAPTSEGAGVEEDNDANGGWCKDDSPRMCTAGKSRCKEPGYRLMHCQRTCGLCEGAADRERCLSFKHPMCPPTDLPPDASKAEKAKRKHDCEALALSEHAIRPPAEAKDSADGLKVGGWCGTRQQRDNPCFEEDGVTYCLPKFFILGEMKCGTTTLYQLLAKHPRIALPATKEPRYLAPPRYGTTTLVSYSREFQAAVEKPGSITFDASPVYLAESIEDSRRSIASSWLLRWLPQSRFIVMVRDPVQRAYSHFKMGIDFMRADSKRELCPPDKLARAFRSLPILNFTGLMQRSLLEVMQHEECREFAPLRPWVSDAMRKKVSASTPLAQRETPLNLGPNFGVNSLQIEDGAKAEAGLRCLRKNLRDDATSVITPQMEAEVLGLWPTSDTDHLAWYNDAVRALHCSEMMLTPKTILKGRWYVDGIAAWVKDNRRRGAHVATDERANDEGGLLTPRTPCGPTPHATHAVAP